MLLDRSVSASSTPFPEIVVPIGKQFMQSSWEGTETVTAKRNQDDPTLEEIRRLAPAENQASVEDLIGDAPTNSLTGRN